MVRKMGKEKEKVERCVCVGINNFFCSQGGGTRPIGYSPSRDWRTARCEPHFTLWRNNIPLFSSIQITNNLSIRIFQPIAKLVQPVLFFIILGINATLRHVLKGSLTLIGLLEFLASFRDVGLDTSSPEEPPIHCLGSLVLEGKQKYA